LEISFSQVVFACTFSPDLLWKGLKWALALGINGGLHPAVSAACMPVPTGLRAL
jgi:putative ABC transport system permease protein